MQGRYFRYSDLMKELHGQKVYKLPVNYAQTCPNRDGVKGYGGCIFCSEKGSSHEAHENTVPVAEQINNNAAYIGSRYGAKLFDVYFQSYTNTYMSIGEFENIIFQACETRDDIVGLSISTRPDCVHRDYLDVLKNASLRYGVDITVELGLQSVNTQTLKILKRGHTLTDYIQSVMLIKAYGFNVCTHIISTLPWDTVEDLVECAKLMNLFMTYKDSVKVHTLYIEEGCELARMYKSDEFEMPDIDDYLIRTSSFLGNLKEDIAVARLTGRIGSEGCLFSNWGRSHWVIEDMLMQYMAENDIFQGKFISDGCSSAVQRYTTDK
ncbi:MAG: TIGR01212 family radical SAM protein [Anaerofustis stercorihominis]|nr:TIGR01212 family radical SAM protein [Anaerofustis stercorihominis]